MESELALHDAALVTKSDIQMMRLDLHEVRHDLELKIESLRGELRAELQALSGELKSEIKGTIRWNFAFWITQLAAMAGILKLLR
jgi:hypothetical protein